MSTIFTEQDRKAWLAFLDSPSGRAGLAYLRENKRPAIRPSAAPHEMHMDLGRQLGFDDGLIAVEKVARMPDPDKFRTADREPLADTRSRK